MHILRGVTASVPIADLHKVAIKCIVRDEGTELGLPGVAVCVHEARGNNAIGSIDSCDREGAGDIWSDLENFGVVNKDVAVF